MKLMSNIAHHLLSILLLISIVSCKKESLTKSDSADAVDKTQAVMLKGEAMLKEEFITADFSADSLVMNFDMEGIKLSGKMVMRTVTKEHYDYVSSDSVYYTVVYDSTFEKVEMMGSKEDTVKQSPLTGIRLLKVKDGGSWKFVPGSELTAEQLKELEDIDPNDDDVYMDELCPDTKVKIGDTWNVDSAGINSVLTNGIPNANCFGKMKFVDIVVMDNIDCALLEGDVRIQGGDEELEMVWDSKIRIFRSLQHFTDLKVEMNGNLTFKGVGANITMTGPVNVSYLSSVN